MRRPIGFPMFAFVCSLPLHGQTPSDELLQRAIRRVRDSTERLSKLVCSEAMDRIEVTVSPQPPRGCQWWHPGQDIRTAAAGVPQWDRVRVDVLSTSEGELYSWPGEGRFHDQDLLRLVRIRPLSTGGFSDFLGSIFAPGSDFSSRGEVIVGQRKLREYSFRVPRERSRYWVGTGATRRAVPCEGTFAISPDTAELVSLVVRSSEPPEPGGICSATTTLVYGGISRGGAEIPLPSSSVFDFATTDGRAARNAASYSNCHEFRAESTLRFEEPATAEPIVRPHTQESLYRLPQGLAFRIVLTQEIAFDKVAAGDTVQAKLDTPIRDESKRILVPAGTRLVFRVLDADVARALRTGGQTLIAHLILRLESTTASGTARLLVATSAQRIETADPAARSQGSSTNTDVAGYIRDPNVGKLLLAPNTFMLEFFNIDRKFVLKPGSRSSWRTGGTGPSAGCLAGVSACGPKPTPR